MLQKYLQGIFNYLQVKQRLVLCFFSFLAIINAYTIRLCLDYSFSRIAREGDVVCTKKSKRLTGGRSIASTYSTKSQRIQAAKPALKKLRENIRTARVEWSPKQKQLQNLSTSNCSDVWTKEVQVLVTVSFYVGYMITHIPGGRLAERYGGKWILGGSILFAAFLTLLTPSIVRHSGPGALVVVRMLIGFCEGPTFPAVCALLAQWVPENERGLLASCVLSAGEIGITFMHLVGGLSLGDQDWAIAFYVVGTGAILWFVGFVILCYSKPDASPFIQSSERDYIKKDSRVREVDEMDNNNKAAPWSSMMCNGSTWALIAASVQHDWNQQQQAEEMQQTFEELKRKEQSMWEDVENSLKTSAPHLYSWLATLTTGGLSDYLIAEGILTRTQTRRLMSWIVFISVSMYLVYEKEPNARVWSVMAFGAYYAGIKLLPLDMSPNYAGSLMAISNGLGALPSLLLPLLQQLESQYAIVGSIRAAIWLICAGYISADVQSYNQCPAITSSGSTARS